MSKVRQKSTRAPVTNEVSLPPLRRLEKTEFETDILVVGGGYAGVFAALKAAEKGQRVILVDKGIVGKSGQSPWAGGLSFFDASLGDDYDDFLWGAQKRSEFVGNMDYVKMWLDDSKSIYNELLSWGVVDPKRSDEEYWDADKESAGKYLTSHLKHDRHEIMKKKLVDRGIPILERVMLTDLLVQDGRVVGAAGFWMESEEVIIFHAKATILCTGAGSYGPVGMATMGCTFDGDAMAYRAGAAITGKEYVDSHLTSHKTPGAVYELIDVYVNPLDLLGLSLPGKMRGGRDTLGQTVYNIMRNGFAPAPMISPPPPKQGDPRGGHALIFKKDHYSTVMGADVGMAPHKSEGISPVDARCFSGIPGLYAAGDALASVSGAEYAGAGMSCGASAVQGKRAAEAASDYAAQVDILRPPEREIARITERITAPLRREKGFDPRWLKDVLLTTMAPAYILYVKNKPRLEGALENVKFMQEYLANKLRATNPHELRLCHEVANMVLNAEMKLRASLMRTESRGCHFRQDYPARNDKEWLAWLLIKQDSNGKMILIKKPVPETWVGDLNQKYNERYLDRFPGELEYLNLA